MILAYDRLEHLRQALFWEPDTPIMIVKATPFTAHADDSGKKETPMVVVAGYLADAAHWALFQKAWMTKVEKRGWPEFKRSSYDLKKLGGDFLSELTDLIWNHVAFGYANILYSDDWRKVANKYALELHHALPYPMCARTCIGHVRAWCAAHDVKSEYMAYIFDKGSQNSGELTELLKLDDSRAVRKISLTQDDSDRIAGLQASDFLAWEIRNQFLNHNPDPQSWADFTPELAYLLRGRSFDFDPVRKMPIFGFYRQKDIERFCVNTKMPLLKDIPVEIWNRPKPIRLKWPATKP